jgi:hypothetical protein
MRRLCATATTVFALALGTQALGVVWESTFDSDLDGWTGSGGTMSFSATGGNPGGFLRREDADATTMSVFAPAKFLGDLTAFEGGMLSFDAIALGTVPDFTPFGTVTIRSGAMSATSDLAPSGHPFVGEWFHFSNTLQNFGTTDSLHSILANVTEIEIVLEYADYDSVRETVGFDSFVVDTVPEPAGLGLAVLVLSRASFFRATRKDR